MDKTLGELIQEALTELGWKNAELARRTGFSATYIGNLIRDYSPGTKSGKPTRLPVETVDRIADALKKPRSPFRRAAGLLPEDYEVADLEVERAAQATRTAQLIQNWNDMTPEEQTRTLAVIEAMRAKHPEALEILGPKFKVTNTREIDLSQPHVKEEKKK